MSTVFGQFEENCTPSMVRERKRSVCPRRIKVSERYGRMIERERRRQLVKSAPKGCASMGVRKYSISYQREMGSRHATASR